MLEIMVIVPIVHILAKPAPMLQYYWMMYDAQARKPPLLIVSEVTGMFTIAVTMKMLEYLVQVCCIKLQKIFYCAFIQIMFLMNIP